MSNRTPKYGKGPLTVEERNWYKQHRVRMFGQSDRLPVPLPKKVFQGFPGRPEDARKWLSLASRLRAERKAAQKLAAEKASGWRPAQIPEEPVVPVLPENLQGQFDF